LAGRKTLPIVTYIRVKDIVQIHFKSLILGKRVILGTRMTYLSLNIPGPGLINVVVEFLGN
jgi:hypothetical protein